jgi:6,7-dimethyl-8-ribityllumazine synthase
MSKAVPEFQPAAISPSARVAIAAARFNSDLVDALIDGCRRRLTEIGVGPERVELHRVPGAFELPLAAKVLAESGRFAAVICLGCVIRGDTPHFEYVAGQCVRGIGQVSLKTRLPIIFGVLTTENLEQARARASSDPKNEHGHAGRRAAEAAVEMIALLAAIQKRPKERKP